MTSENPEDDFASLLAEFMPPDMKEVIKEKEAGLPKEKKGGPKHPDAPADSLDLHEHTSEEAKRRIGFFIQNSHHNRLKTVEIITGKGIHSSGGKPILRDIAEEKINDLIKQKLVKSFKWDNGKKERSGSMIVYLN
jgi:DNA-nicking Smr family endonuclease